MPGALTSREFERLKNWVVEFNKTKLKPPQKNTYKYAFYGKVYVITSSSAVQQNRLNTAGH
jgi:hypothetical protein